jgi:hypothetical protein
MNVRLCYMITQRHKISVKFPFLTKILSALWYHGDKQKGVIRVFRAKKAVVQVLLIAAGIAMVCFGALRGEAGTVLNKAIRLCLECVGIG